ncbi:MAG: hypothetical protein M1372_02350 [Patescibacteria group bacterium]|nr:hypothetical protein [Patescibacteria group bacterium]
MIRHSFKNLLVNSTSLEQIYEEIIKFFADIRKQYEKIGYVSGIITSDGLDKIEYNRKKLMKYTKVLEEINNFPLFSAVDIFSDDIYLRIKEKDMEHNEREKKFAWFWGGGY